MIKRIGICSAALLMSLMLMGTAFSKETFEQELRRCIAAYYNLDQNRTEIEIRRNRLSVSPEEYDSLAVEALTKGEPRGLLALEVTLFKDGERVRSGQIRINIAHFEYVLVAADRIKRHDPLSSDKIIIVRKETTSLTDKALTDPAKLAGKWARRIIGKNRILTSSMVEQIPAVVSGEKVAIVYSSGGLDIATHGTALESGYIGDKIKVKNDQSRKIITATVTNAETVEVSLL
ncbi:MAG: flagellar basal body P-ring formation protein FlgA [Candidatus Zixiibacteriota bacterium]|nr:MAG: flagellar basal body P-ring formation protein FlgA [candidate division Zixibacteria bacterium]